MMKDVNTRLQLENQRLKVDLANRSPRRLAHLHQLSSFMLRLKLAESHCRVSDGFLHSCCTLLNEIPSQGHMQAGGHRGVAPPPMAA